MFLFLRQGSTLTLPYWELKQDLNIHSNSLCHHCLPYPIGNWNIELDVKLERLVNAYLTLLGIETREFSDRAEDQFWSAYLTLSGIEINNSSVKTASANKSWSCLFIFLKFVIIHRQHPTHPVQLIWYFSNIRFPFYVWQLALPLMLYLLLTPSWSLDLFRPEWSYFTIFLNSRIT